MTCELIQCLVRIGCDAAKVLMVAAVEGGKVESLTMRYSEFENHSMGKHHGEN